MTISEMFNSLVEGKKLKIVDEDDTKFIHIVDGKLVNEKNEPIELTSIDASKYVKLSERVVVYQWCFYNSESGDWVLNPSLMTEEKAKVEFESAGIKPDEYFKTSTKFSVLIKE